MAKILQKPSRTKEDQPFPPSNQRRRSIVRVVIGLVLVALVIAFSLIVLIGMHQRIDAAGEAEKALLQRGLQNDYIVCVSLLIIALGITFGLAPVRRHVVLCIIVCAVWGCALLVVGEAAYLVGDTIIHSSDRDDTSEAQYAVVVGEPLRERQATGELAARLDTAAGWWKEQNDNNIVIIVSNASAVSVESDFEEEAETQEAAVEVSHAGRVKSKGNTPSSVMKSTLEEKGVPKYAVKEEKVSDSVRSCFEQVLKQFNKIREDTPVVIITNGCYMNDTVRIAKEVGFTNISRLPAASGFKGYVTDVLWETWLRCDPVLKAAE